MAPATGRGGRKGPEKTTPALAVAVSDRSPTNCLRTQVVAALLAYALFERILASAGVQLCKLGVAAPL